MMHSCASAAKLRGGGPILFLGTKAMAQAGTPPPRTVIGDPSQADGLGPKLSGVFSDLRSLRQAQNHAIWHHALAHQAPQGDQKLARQGHDHGLASTAGVLGTGPKPLRQGTVFLEHEKSPRQLHHPSPNSDVARPPHSFLPPPGAALVSYASSSTLT